MSDYRLEVEVSSENAIRNLNSLQSSLERLNSTGDKTTSNLARTGNSAASASKGFNLLSQSSNAAGEGMMRLQRGSNDLNGSMMLLTKSLLSYEIAARAISAADNYLAMTNRLKLVTDSQQELSVAMNDTFEISQKTGAAWGTTVQIYQRFLDVSDKVGKSQAEIGRITETVSKTVAMSGATAESANAAMIQFSQGIASGVLRGEEFNSVAEQTPALLDAIARGLGKDRSELRAMAKQGKLTTEVILDSLQKAEGSTDQLFNNMTLGVAATFNKLRNETTKWVGEMNTSSGATSTLVAMMNLLAENLDGAVFLAGAAALTVLTKSIIGSTTATMTAMATKNAERTATIAQIQAITLSTNATVASTAAKVASTQASVAEATAQLASATTAKQVALAKALLAAREGQLAIATSANTAAIGAQTVATNTLATATSRLAVAKTAALGLLGGGAGLVAMGVSAAAMYFLMSKNSDVSAEAALKHAKYVDMDREAIEKLNSAQKAGAIDEMTASLATQNAELKTAQSRYSALVNDVANGLSKAGRSQDLQEVYSLLTKVRTGVISFEEATDSMNKKKMLTPEQRAQLLQSEQSYMDIYRRALEAATGLESFGQKATITGSAANNAALKNDILNKSLDDTAEKAKAADAEMQKYLGTLESSIKRNAYIVARTKDGVGLDKAKKEADYFVSTGKAPDASMQRAIDIELDYAKKVKALEDNKKKQGKVASKEEKDRLKQQRDSEKEAERSRLDRLRDFQGYVDDSKGSFEEVYDDYHKFLRLYDEFGGGNAETLDKVKAQIEERMAVLVVAQDEFLNQYNDYWYTETDKINEYYKHQEYLLRFSTKVTKDERAKMTADLNAAWANEISLQQLKWDMERLEAKKAFMTEKAYIEELNKLKHSQIDLTPNLTEDQKSTLHVQQQNDTTGQVNEIDQKAWNDYSSVMGNIGTNPQEDLMVQLDAQREIVRAAHDQGVIDKQTYLEALNILDTEYMTNSQHMWTALWGDSLTGWASFFKNVSGENSSAYKAIFAIQKGFTIATAALNIQKAISDGWATGATIYDKMAAVATVITQTGTIMSEISSISAGFKDGGYTGSVGKNNIAGVVHGNEFVMPAEKTSQYRNQLESMRNGSYNEGNGGGNTFNFNNYFTLGEGASAQSQTDANVMGNALNAAMKVFILQSLGQGGMISNWYKSQGGR